MHNNSIDSLAILGVVEQSIQLEFDAYKTVLNYEMYLDSLQTVFAKGQFLAIKKRLIKSADKKWIMSNEGNPSFAILYSSRIDSVKEDTVAYVTTIEKWYLNWFNVEDSTYDYKYGGTINEQKYLLRKNDDLEWLIYQNLYAGNAPKEIPQYHNCSFFKDDLQSFERVYKSLNKYLTKGEVENTLTILRCYTFDQEKFKNIYQKAVTYSNTYKDLQRYLNTKMMPLDGFTTEKTSIAQKIKNLIDQLMKEH